MNAGLSQPALEILYADHMLNLGVLYFNRSGSDRADALNPSFVTENPQRLGDRLVDAASTNFNRMFNFLKIETRKCATSSEPRERSIIRFYFAKPACQKDLISGALFRSFLPRNLRPKLLCESGFHNRAL
jgi:hypothetical protein